MKILIKSVITAIAMVLFGTEALEAQEIKISGQVRYRTEKDDRDFSDDTPSFGNSLLRSRLNMKFSKEKSFALIQVQDARILGTETNTLTDGTADALDFHQAYFAVNDFITPGLSVLVGRRKVAFANERIIGSVGWHNIGRSFDGVTLIYKGEKYTANLFNLKEAELSVADDIGDKDVRGLWIETSVLSSTRIDLFAIKQVTDPGNVLDRNTAGVYLKGRYDLGSFDLSQETDLAVQSGKNGRNDVSASLFGTRISLAAKDAEYKYWIGVGYDLVSGDDTTSADDETFNTLYATNHKYYGFMDYFLNVPDDAMGAGLTDIILSGGFSPKARLSVKADYHLMSTSEDVISGSTIGTELDVTAVYGYSKNLKIVGGVSTFSPDDVFTAWKGPDDSIWGYLMAIYNF